MRPGLYTAAKIQCLFYLWFCSFSNLYHHLYLICTKCRNVMSAAVFTKVTQTWSWETWVFWVAAAAAAKSLQSCPTLCDSIDGSPPGSPVTGTLEARTLEWVAISFSNAWKWKMKSHSHVQLFVTPWAIAYQAPLSMGFARQEYWSGVPLPSPKELF